MSDGRSSEKKIRQVKGAKESQGRDIAEQDFQGEIPREHGTG